MGKIILASSSPRRADILEKHNYEFEIIPSPYQEDYSVADFSCEFIEDLAYCKAELIIPLLDEPAVIIGADTVVVLDGKILGKPKDFQEAYFMLKSLSGRVHEVITGIAVIDTAKNTKKTVAVTSKVEFYKLTDEQIATYINEFKPFDKAGAYGIQELPMGILKSYEGSFENIVGLSSTALAELLKD